MFAFLPDSAGVSEVLLSSDFAGSLLDSDGSLLPAQANRLSAMTSTRRIAISFFISFLLVFLFMKTAVQ